MRIDEDSLRVALHDLPDEVPVDLVDRVHRGGRRRLRRRRLAVVATSAFLAAAGAGAGLSLGSTDHSTTTLAPAGTPVKALYAAPPPAGADCTSGNGAHADPVQLRQLLWLPQGTQVHYAFVRVSTTSCPAPHVALTLLKQDGSVVTSGAVVYGPDAPTPEQAGMAGGTRVFTGDTGHATIGGSPATEFTIDGFTDAFWSDDSGGQWHAQVRGMSQSAAVALLDGMHYDDAAGTATLAGATGDGWTVAPAAADEADGPRGTVLVQWTLPSGHVADATVTATPSRLDQLAATSVPNATVTTVSGHRAVLSTSMQFALVYWQPDDNVAVQVAIERGTAAEALAAAESLAVAPPDDTRISPN